MKLKTAIFFVTTLLLLSSCSSVYEVFEVSSNDVKSTDKSIIFEDKDVKLSYNFWADGGLVYFTFTNKTNAELYIDWDKSHFIYNGISNEYWNDLEESNSSYASVSSTTSDLLFGKSYAAVSTTKMKSKKVIYLPPNSSVIISKFKITKKAYFDCNFNTRTSNPIYFTKDNSPLEFRNQIVYAENESFTNKVSVDNSFYVSTISFVSGSKFLGKSLNRKNCNINGLKSNDPFNELPYKKPNSFYLTIKTNQ